MQSKIFGVPLAIIILVLAIVVPLGGVSYVNYLQNRETLTEVKAIKNALVVVTPMPTATVEPMVEATPSAKPRKTAVPTPIEEGATVPVAQ